MSKTFASLSVPNYRRYFIGFTLSNIGQWMARTALGWLVLITLTDGNASALGWLTSLNFAPTLLLAPLAGSVADRMSKRTIINVAQAWMMIDGIILATLVLTGNVKLWHVFLIAFSDGCAAAFDGPARQAFVSEVVPLSQLPNAISLNSASFNAARLLGPGIGGVLIAMVDTGPVLALNVLSFATMIWSLSRLNRDQLQPARAKRGEAGLRAGMRYVWARPDIMILLLVGFVMGTFAFNTAISNAVMATQAFHKGPSEYGLLGSWMGVGALIASLWAARRKRPRIRFVLEAMAAYAVIMLASALSPNYSTFAALQIPTGLALITVVVTANALIQISVEPSMRGRVMSLWGAVILGGTPVVAPIIGWLGDALGPRWTVVAQAVPVGVAFIGITWWIMAHDQLKVRFDPKRPAPWLRLVRGTVTVDVGERVR